MGTSARTHRQLALALVAALVAALALVGVGTAPAQAATKKGTVTGQVLVKGNVPLRMRWFNEDWQFMDERKVNGPIYDLTLPVGTYYLQFVDERPAYDIKKYAPTDIKVVIRKDKTVQRDVRMKIGAAITGTVRGGGKALAGARVVAANANEQSFETKANDKGQFAIGGLPDGSYSIFTFDRKKEWVGKSTYLRGLKARQVRNTAIALKTRAGSLRVELKTGREKLKQKVFVTAISKASGQFWTVKATKGVAIFNGLFPGKYSMVVPRVGIYLADQGPIAGADVKSGRADLVSSFTWTKLAARMTGTVVDGRYPDYEMKDVIVELRDADGNKLTSTVTNDQGKFWMNIGTPTLKNVTVRIKPGGFTAPYMQGEEYCKFGSSETPQLSVAKGDELDLGTLALPHLPSEQQDSPNICGQ
jgi:hypothetical protein